MTDTQKQCLLVFLGYDTGGIGNGWGPKSKAAMTAFCRDFGGVSEADGPQALKHAVAYGMPERDKPSTGTFWDEIEYFTREEFRCQCKGKYCNGFPAEPEEKIVRTVNEIRKRLGVPVSIVDAGGSGVRCKQHNANVGGVANSEHLYGRAADLHSSASPQRMKQVAEEVMGNTGGIGLYSWGIHVDTGKYSRWNG